MTAAVDVAELCDYCGLPAASSSDSHTAEANGPVYCCFGCRFAAAVTAERGAEGALRWTLTRLGLAIFFTMNVMVFTMALWTHDVYAVDLNDQMAASFRSLLRYLCLIFSLPVLFLLGRPLLENAVGQLRRGVWSIDLLLAVGVVAAVVFSGWSVIRDDGHVYFEVACMVLVMVTLGRWMEAHGRQKATDALDRLQDLLPETVRRLAADGSEADVALESVAVGDRLRVGAGERIPVDGVVVTGAASIDQQVLTGESQPVLKQAGDEVWSGTLNLDADLVLEASCVAGAGAFAKLVELVRTARLSRGRFQSLADRVGRWFFPLVVLLATVTLLLHAGSGWNVSLMAAMSVVLIACPCALGLATPLAVWTALGNAARHQVIFRSGRALEQLADVRAVCFDKTGTLTTGTPRVEQVHLGRTADPALVRGRTRALTRRSNHPVARAIESYFRSQADWPEADQVIETVQTSAGLGLVGQLADAGDVVLLGNARFLGQHGQQMPVDLESLVAADDGAGSRALLGWGGEVQCVFTMSEQLRESAEQALSACQDAGLVCTVLTGDRMAQARRLQQRLRVDVHGELLPQDKLEHLRSIQSRLGSVAMVGDGINDAPALAASDIGVAMGCGTDVSRDAAAVCLLSDDLSRLPWAVQLARRTRRVVIQNLTWALGYNAVGIGLAMAGMLNPVVAALMMIGSSFVVVTNSLRLGRSPAGSSRETPGSSRVSSGETIDEGAETGRQPERQDQCTDFPQAARDGAVEEALVR